MLIVVVLSISACGSSSDDGDGDGDTAPEADDPSDTFDTNTQADWTVDATVSSWSTWEELNADGILSISDGALNYDFPTSLIRADIYKNITFTSTGFEYYVDITPTTAVDIESSQILAIVGTPDLSITLSAGLHGKFVDGQQYCGVTFDEEGEDQVSAESSEPCLIGSTYRVKITVDTTSGMTASYATGGNTYTLTPETGAFPTAATVNQKILDYAGDTWQLRLAFTNGPSAGTVDGVIATGLTVE
jgi:hypothetical protein